MRLLICGGRDYTDRDRIRETVLDHLDAIDIVISGRAPGADILGESVAEEFSIPIDPYPAHWRHTFNCPPECNRVVGKPAGPIRNRQMLDEGRPDEVWGFHNNIIASKGTKDMLNIAHKRGIPTYLFDEEGWSCWIGMR